MFLFHNFYFLQIANSFYFLFKFKLSTISSLLFWRKIFNLVTYQIFEIDCLIIGRWLFQVELEFYRLGPKVARSAEVRVAD